MKKDRSLEIMDEANLFSLREQKGHILNFSKKAKEFARKLRITSGINVITMKV
jgi:hypothetical protein